MGEDESKAIMEKTTSFVNVQDDTQDEELSNAGENEKLGGRSLEPRFRSSMDIRATPWFVWPVYICSILAGASSAALTRSIEGAAPLALACWRHQVSGLVLLPGFVWQFKQLSKSEFERLALPSTFGLLCVSSFGLACHFATYIWSLDHTSMTHTLFLSSLSPMFVALYTKLTGGALLAGETIGISFGLVGVAILAAGSRAEDDATTTLSGDLVALTSGACVALYFIAGRKLRVWMPLFIYQFQVTLAAILMLAMAAAVAQSQNWAEGAESGTFAWVRKEYLLGTVLLGVIPGLFGHAAYSAVLKYGSPLLVPTGMSLQPMLGSALGWAVGEASVPGLWTCLGGLVTLAGTLCVSYSGEQNKMNSKPKFDVDEYRLPAEDAEGQQETKPLLQSSELP